MRIGLVINEFDRLRGGMAEWCWQLVATLAERDHELHIITERFGEATLPPQVVRHIVPRTKSRLGFANAAAQSARDLDLDIVHDTGAGWFCHIFQPHGGALASVLKRKLDMYTFWHRAVKRPIDALLPRRREFVRLWRKQYAGPESTGKTFLALSHTVANDFVRLHGVSPEQIEIVYNGVDCRRFSPDHRSHHREPVRRRLGVDEQTVLLLAVAHNFRLKGVPELLRLMRRLADDGRPVHLAVVGGKRLARWRSFAERLGIGQRTTFVGSVADTVPYYAAADLFVHPTYFDPCSLVLLEAAASGLPIITTRRHNGAAELFREEEDILTVADPFDADGLYQQVDSLLVESLRAKFGAAAREVALRQPFERNVAQILHMYERCEDRRLAA